MYVQSLLKQELNNKVSLGTISNLIDKLFQGSYKIKCKKN